jgi:hypothetical protein
LDDRLGCKVLKSCRDDHEDLNSSGRLGQDPTRVLWWDDVLQRRGRPVCEGVCRGYKRRAVAAVFGPLALESE